MNELSLNSFHLAQPIFANEKANAAVVMAILEGNNPGRVWVDHIAHPKIALVISNACYSFLGHHNPIHQACLGEIIQILKYHKPIKLIWQKGNTLSSLFSEAGFSPVERIQLNHPALAAGDTSLIDQICITLPNDCEIKPIDETLVQKSQWLNYIRLFYGSEANFLQHGFGLALLKKGKLVSEAMTCYIGGGLVETGSVTTEENQGKGYATIVRAFLIRECLNKNLQPITSCNVNNPASAAVSKKLGFVEHMKYQFLTI